MMPKLARLLKIRYLVIGGAVAGGTSMKMVTIFNELKGKSGTALTSFQKKE